MASPVANALNTVCKPCRLWNPNPAVSLKTSSPFGFKFETLCAAMLDLLLVGAGPHNLCLLLRLLEPLGAPVDVIRRPPSSKRNIERLAHKQVMHVICTCMAWMHAPGADSPYRGR